MTKAVRRDSIKDETCSNVSSHLKDEHGTISDHLCNHVHLTNCIHLKNHMHRRSSNFSEGSLMRDLIVLQKSRSLRDPSTSPISWVSPYIVGGFARKAAKVGSANRRRRSIGRRRKVDQLSKSSLVGSVATAKVAAVEAASDCNFEERDKEAEITKGEETGRRSRKSDTLSGIGAHHNLIIASNSVALGSKNQKSHLKDVEEDTELEATQAQRNVCGIPWNWSRIHHRGKTFLDIAGRSFSCGLSDSRMKKAEGPVPQREGNTSNMATASTSSDSDMLPLLIETQESQESGANHFPLKDYSGELEIYSEYRLRHDRDSDLSSEARSGQQRCRQCGHGRHRSLTQKYIPKTFKDLVGQNLIVQALSNAILRRKVGLIYVFHGPHGTGKTSCARVFAKALNCQSLEHPRPCDVCNSCISNNLGRNRDVVEVGPIGNFDFESIKDVFDNVMLSPRSSLYKVFILDDCDSLPSNLWNTISKVIDRAPRHVIFVLVCLNLDRLPHIVISRCQKFFFPKVRDSDIISTLQWIATCEGLDIDKDALKLVASQSDGSLRDAVMTLDQLCLLGKKISLPLVQELVGLVSDEKLVDLLDLALSADTVNTVKNLREIMETGVDPLALMSQLATIITDILAGSYVFTQERLRRKFFCRLTLSKEDMERLRQALKKLSEAEKQLRVSSDKVTWLTAALLQLAPDQHYVLPSSSTGRSLKYNPMILDNPCVREMHRSSADKQDEMQPADGSFARGVDQVYHNSKGVNDAYNSIKMVKGKGHFEQTSHNAIVSSEAIEASDIYSSGKRHNDTKKLWQAVLECIPLDTLRQFLHHEGKLNSVSLGAAPTVQLEFSSNANKSRAEKFRGQILQAFESVLASPVILEIRCKSRNSIRSDVQAAPLLSRSGSGSSKMTMKQQSVKNQKSLYLGSENLTGKLTEENILRRIGSSQYRWQCSGPHVMTEDEIIEAEPHEHELTNKPLGSKEKGLGSAQEEASTLQHHANLVPFSEKKENEQNQRKSLIRGKVSLAHVIQQAEGCSQQGGWSRRKAMSIAEKIEQENLRLEPRSRSLFCWKASRITRAKPLKLKIRTRKPCSLLKLAACGRCLHTRSPK